MEVKANELRIGNLISINRGDIMTVSNINKKWITTDFVHEYAIKSMKPIPLTEEWLLKMGFDSNEWNSKFSANTMYWDKVDCILHIGDKRDANYSFMAECNYVHQFQNLYFALTGSELTINK